jgi:glycosyltransferase involved in cell wall biosynthesis
MRIWSFPSFYPNHLPGRRWNGIFAHRQNLGLMANGADVKVIHPVMYCWPSFLQSVFKCRTDLNSRNLPRSRQMDGIEIFHPVIPDPRPSRLFHQPYGELYKSAVKSFFAQQQIQFTDQDFFYAQWVPEAGIVVELGKELGVKTGVLVIGDDVLVLPKKSEAAKTFFCSTMVNADYRFAVSNSLALAAQEIVGRNLPFTVVRRGVDADVFHPANDVSKPALREQYQLPGDSIVCLCVATLLHEKGWGELLDALQRLVPLFPHLLLVAVYAGHGNFDLPQEVNRRGLQKHVVYKGEVAPAQMPDMYRLADIFCMASHSEGISNAVTEAMASGLPVVTTNLPGHLELIAHQQTGLLVAPKNAEALYTALHWLLHNSSLKNEMGASARKFIEQVWGSFAFNSKRIMDTFSAGPLVPAGENHIGEV